MDPYRMPSPPSSLESKSIRLYLHPIATPISTLLLGMILGGWFVYVGYASKLDKERTRQHLEIIEMRYVFKNREADLIQKHAVEMRECRAQIQETRSAQSRSNCSCLDFQFHLGNH